MNVVEASMLLEELLLTLATHLFQLLYLLFLLFLCVACVFFICAPFIWMYCAWRVQQEDKAKPSASSDPANAADAEQVKGRAPGSSDHASPIRRTEARAERTLEHPPP